MMHSFCSSAARVGDDAGAGLDMDHAVLDEGGAQHDAGVHLPVGREVADAAAVGPALGLFQLVDDLHRPHFRRARQRAGGKARHQRVDGVVFRIERADDGR